MIEDQVTDIALFGNGGFSWKEAWELSFLQREKVIKKINEYNKAKSGDTREWMG